MEENRYTKDEIKNSARFGSKRDAVEALLKDDRLYSIEEADEIIRSFMEGCV